VVSFENVTVVDTFVTGGSYTVTCTSGENCVSSAEGAITVDEPCEAQAPPVTICEGRTLAQLEDAIEDAGPSCTGESCDATPVVTFDNVTVVDTFVTGGSYTVTCTSAENCVSSAEGAITVVELCDVLALDLQVTCTTLADLEELIVPTQLWILTQIV
jgi:hypothetical protein